MDREVLRLIWLGRIPAQFSLAEEDGVYRPSQSEKSPLYLMLPRVSYFPLIIDKIRRHFFFGGSDGGTSGDTDSRAIWLQFDNKPLKWHLPIGLQYDRLVGSRNKAFSAGQVLAYDDFFAGSEPQKEPQPLPWHIKVQVIGYPSEDLPVGVDGLRASFMWTVKEADALRHHGAVVNAMQEKEHHALWTALLNNVFDQFWLVNRKFHDPLVNGQQLRHVPVRVYAEGGGGVRQRLLRPFLQDRGNDQQMDRATTVADALLLFGVATDCSTELHVITHGIRIPLEAPLLWLSQNLSYPDGFLHLVTVNHS